MTMDDLLSDDDDFSFESESTRTHAKQCNEKCFCHVEKKSTVMVAQEIDYVCRYSGLKQV